MKPLLNKALPATLAALAASSFASADNSYKEATQHLDLDGSFIAYMDFDGDGQAVGEQLNELYREYAAANPNVPPIPLDFPALFQTLGFGSIRAMGMSSTDAQDGLQRNRSVMLLDGEPAGLLAFYDMTNTGFRAAEFAPADTTTAFTGSLDFTAWRETAVALMSQVMGPVGEGMTQQGLMQPIPGTDVTVDEVISALSGPVDFVISQDFENIQKPETKVWTRLGKAGALLPRLEPLIVNMGISFVADAKGRTADLSPLMEGAPMSLYLHQPEGSDELIVYTDAAWVAGFGSGEKLADRPEFQRVVSPLPKQAAFFAYSAGFDPAPIYAMLEGQPDMAAYLPLIKGAVEIVIGDLLKPNASVTYLAENAMVTEQYADYSYKGLILAVPAGIGAGAGIVAAIQQAKEAGSDSDSDSESEWEEEAEGEEGSEYEGDESEEPNEVQ